MKRIVSILLLVTLLVSQFVPLVNAESSSDAPFIVSAYGTELEAVPVGTANIPELDSDLFPLISYYPTAYLVSVPYGCNEVKLKATDESLIMGETSDSQVLTDATPDSNGFLSILQTQRFLRNHNGGMMALSSL